MLPIEIPQPVAFESQDINEKHLRSFVFEGEFPAVPLTISAESRCQGVPGWDGPDYQYSAYATLFYDDGSTFCYNFLDFDPGDHGWQRLTRYIRPRLPALKIQVDYFFEHKRGAVDYWDLVITEAPPRPEPDRRVALLGDSNVITYYLHPSDRVDAFLQASLADSHPGVSIEVENCALGGDAVRNLLDSKRYERDLLTLGRIDVAFIRYGLNDMNRYDPATFESLQRELVSRLRSDFPGIRIVLETSTFIDFPAHNTSDTNARSKPYFEVTRRLGAEIADGLVDVWEIMRLETERGNWDLRYRSHPLGKLILDGRFDAEFDFAPSFYSNPHHTPPANRLVAAAEHEMLVKEGWLT